MQFVPITERQPVQIGGVPLNYIRGPYFPTLSKTRIYLPVSPDAKLAKLHGDTQFLYLIDAAKKHLFWGGMDEQSAFLSRVSLDVLPRLAQEEEAFYEEIKHPVIRYLESIYGSRRWTRRQGDIFIIPLQKTWKEAFELGKGIPHYRYGRIFRTRHVHFGLCVWDYLGFYVTRQTGNIPSQFDSGLTLIASGSLRAPNHATLRFRGPHVVARSAHLLDID